MFNQAAGEGAARRLVLEDAALGGLQVSGVLRPDNVESLLRLLEKEFRIDAIRRGDEVVLRRAR
jgi:ferric-dicitrate binding protein FerR (iron transport regulator)